MVGKQIEQGDIGAICQKWVHSSSGEHSYAGFSVHFTFDALARYLNSIRQEMPTATSPSYTWIDWRSPSHNIGITRELAKQIIESGVEGVRFDADYDYPTEEY